ncbi:MAG: DEAD/DEAH box helicase [Deltaproteobacteria bacterium]|nr:DEAD/DEAH box helicase [Deltaproteobacteria bacterium]
MKTTAQTFAELGLSEATLRGVAKHGFVHPTPIQAKVIPVGLQGHDVIGCAQTGTGKTAAFVLPIADRLTHGKGIRCVILSPTREIALQTKEFLDVFGQGHHLRAAVLIGGVAMGPQTSALRNHPDIVVATPGRLLDHLERRHLNLQKVSEVVLDEADRMLDMGFHRHTMMLSATMPFAVEGLARQYLRDPMRIDVAPPGTLKEGIVHRLYLVDQGQKRTALLRLLKDERGPTLVFVRMKHEADRLARFLLSEGFDIGILHGDRSQRERTEALSAFRTGHPRILVATDIAARGLDIPAIAHVIHYDVPQNAEDYVHRSGRTARYQATGVASVIGTWMDLTSIKAIEKLVGQTLPRCTIEGIPAFVETPPKRFGRLRPRMRH